MSERPTKTWHEELVQLCTSHGRLMFRLAYDILRDAHAAEDACQQALVKACDQCGGLRDSARLRAWLAKVVVNESLQMIRRQGTEQRVYRQIADCDRTPAVSHTEYTLRETILSALAKLPEPNGLIVLLRMMEGLSGNEVKDLLGLSAAEVSRRLYLGMEALRGLLADSSGPRARDGSHGS